MATAGMDVVVGATLLLTPFAPVGAGMVGSGFGSLAGGAISESLGGSYELGAGIGNIVGGVAGSVAYSKFFGGVKQAIPNRYPNEPQSGKRFEYNISDGKLKIRDGINEADFVVDMDGKLHIGRGHSYLANGRDVQAAGILKVNHSGQIRKITNASGHYAPTVSQGRNFPSILNQSGLSTKNAWLVLGDYQLTPSGYVDIWKTVYYSQKLI